MRNRKLLKICALFLAAAVLFCSAGAVETVVNGQTVVFTIINDMLLPLSAYTMPVTLRSAVCVPYSVFSDYLGIRSMYNAEEKVLVLADNEKTLYFDLANDRAYDDDEYGYRSAASAYNGTIYVPARFTANFFGMTYSYDYDTPFVRLRRASASQSDADLKSALAETFKARLEAFQTVKPADPEPEPEPEPPKIPAPAYLMFTGELTEETTVILDELAQRGIHAMFFLTADTIRAREDIVRRIYVEGHLFGLAAPRVPETVEELLGMYGEAGRALFSVLRVHAGNVCMPGGSRHPAYDETWHARLRAAGYRLWDYTVIARDYTADASPEAVIEGTFEALTEVEAVQTLVMHSTPAASGALPGLLDLIAEREGTILVPDFLTPPVTL